MPKFFFFFFCIQAPEASGVLDSPSTTWRPPLTCDGEDAEEDGHQCLDADACLGCHSFAEGELAIFIALAHSYGQCASAREAWAPIVRDEHWQHVDLGLLPVKLPILDGDIGGVICKTSTQASVSSSPARYAHPLIHTGWVAYFLQEALLYCDSPSFGWGYVCMWLQREGILGGGSLSL